MNSQEQTTTKRRIKFIIKKLSLIDSFKSTNLPYEILEIIIDYKKRMEETILMECSGCRGDFKFNKQLYLNNEERIRWSGVSCYYCNCKNQILIRDGYDRCGVKFKIGFYNLFIDTGTHHHTNSMDNKHYIVNIIKITPKFIKFTIQDISNNETGSGPVDIYPSDVYCKKFKTNITWGRQTNEYVPLPISNFNNWKNNPYIIYSNSLFRID